MRPFIDQLLTVSSPWVYVVVGALVFAEAAVFLGFVLPGETAVLLGGVLASAGHLSLPSLLLVVVVAAVAGDSVGYEVGRRFGPRLVRSRFLKRYVARLEGAQTALRRRGGWAVFMGRFTAFLRAVMPALAGTSGMSYLHFLAFNVAGGIVWGVGVTLLGFFGGHSLNAVASTLGGASAALLILFVLGTLTLWHFRNRRHRAAASAENQQKLDEHSGRRL